MSRWGRASSEAQGIAAAPYKPLAPRSVIWAVVAYVVAAATIVLMMRLPGNLPLPWPTLAPLGLFALFAIVVPIIHIVGLIYGARALSRPGERRGLAILGIVLNLFSLGGVLAGVWALLGQSVAPA